MGFLSACCGSGPVSLCPMDADCFAARIPWFACNLAAQGVLHGMGCSLEDNVPVNPSSIRGPLQVS